MPAQLASPLPDPFDACRTVLLAAPCAPAILRERVLMLPNDPHPDWFDRARAALTRDTLTPAVHDACDELRFFSWSSSPKSLGLLSQTLNRELAALRLSIDSHVADHETALEQLVSWRTLTLLRGATQHLESSVSGGVDDHDQTQELAHAMLSLIELDDEHVHSVVRCLVLATAH